MFVRNRRAFIGALLSPAIVAFARAPGRVSSAAAHPALTPEEEEGPFYIAGGAYRSAIAEGHPGVPLRVRIRVLDAATGTPIEAADVDIWHCDALGDYSGYDPMPPPPMPGGGKPPMGPPPSGFGGPPGGMPGGAPPHARQTDAKTFLRGIQSTSRLGIVNFSTIFPGFYQGRTNHIHLKVHLDTSREKTAGRIVHTGQLFFPEAIARAISERKPYASHHIQRVTQRLDRVFTEQRGAATIARVERIPGDAGYLASLTVAVRRA